MDFQHFVQRRVPTTCETHWTSKACLIGTVYTICPHLLAFFKDILHSPHLWDDDAVDAAGGYVSKLQNSEFMVLLEVFQNIFPHTELLFNILQTKRYDISYCNAKVENDKGIIASFRNDEEFNNMWQKSLVSIEEPCHKRTPFEDQPRRPLTMIFFESVDHLLQEISTVFQSLVVLQFVELLDPEKAGMHQKDFPRAAFHLYLPSMVATLTMHD